MKNKLFLIGIVLSIFNAKCMDEISLSSLFDHLQNLLLVNKVCQNDISGAQLLLTFSFNSNAKDRVHEITPLMMARSVEMARLLLDYNADVNAQDGYRRTPLMYAARQKNFALMALLIESGADVNAKSADKQTPLMIASKKNDIESVKLLLANGALVNKQDDDDETALFMAVRKNHYDVAKLLLRYGANPNIDDGLSCPLSIALIKKNIHMVKLLLANGADPLLSPKLRDANQWASTALGIVQAQYPEFSRLLQEAISLNLMNENVDMFFESNI